MQSGGQVCQSPRCSARLVASAMWFRKAAEQGDALAQCTLAEIYDAGRGVPQDHAEALKWHRLAADQDYADAQFNLPQTWMLAAASAPWSSGVRLVLPRARWRCS